MTKQEAIAAMERGEKITHRYFTPEEWMTIIKGENVYTCEDGEKCTPSWFWASRTDPDWQYGYSIFKEPEKLKEPE